ncbi:MAG: rod-binding protein [Bacillota bacterium]
MKLDPIQGMNTYSINESRLKNSESKFSEVLKKAQSSQDKEKLINACQEFESLFIHQMISQMRAAIPEGGLLPKSQGEKIFEDMLDEQYALKMSKSGGIGLAKILYEDLSKNLASTNDDEPSTADIPDNSIDK